MLQLLVGNIQGFTLEVTSYYKLRHWPKRHGYLSKPGRIQASKFTQNSRNLKLSIRGHIQISDLYLYAHFWDILVTGSMGTCAVVWFESIHHPPRNFIGILQLHIRQNSKISDTSTSSKCFLENKGKSQKSTQNCWKQGQTPADCPQSRNRKESREGSTKLPNWQVLLIPNRQKARRALHKRGAQRCRRRYYNSLKSQSLIVS